MGRFINYSSDDNIIDNKKEPTYTNDPETGTLIENKDSIDEDKTIKLPKLKVTLKKPTVNHQKKEKKPKNKKSFNFKLPKIKFNKLLLIPIPLIFIIGLVVAYVILRNNYIKNFDVLNTNAFFIENNEGVYSLFNESGKQLSGFDFSTVTYFNNNASLVTNKDGEFGVINNKGKMVVDFGKYPYIFNEGPLYFLTDYDSEYYLINAKGKKIYKEIGFEILNFTDNYVLLKHKDKYKLLNYNGKIITSFKDKSSEEIPVISNKGDFVLLYYDNKIVIYNIRTLKKVTSFDSKERFCITDVTDRDLIINTCDSVGDILVPYSYRAIINKKIKYDLVSNNDQKPHFSGNVIVYEKNGEEYLLNNSGDSVTTTLNTAYADYNHYAKLNNDNTVDIYINNKVKKNIECAGIVSGFIKDKIYLFKDCGSNNEYRYYSIKGKQIGDAYQDATIFNNNLAVIKENDNYYLVNNKMKKLSKAYNNIIYTNIDNYYIATDDNKKIILNNKGKEITSGVDIKILEKETNFGYVAFITTSNSYVVYNLSKEKEITSIISEPTLYEHYFAVNKGSSIDYYSYKNGKMFYSK